MSTHPPRTLPSPYIVTSPNAPAPAVPSASPPAGRPSVLAWSAGQRMLAVLPAVLLLWLGVAWAVGMGTAP